MQCQRGEHWICDLWSLICDLWSVICGLWSVVCGLRSLICDFWSVINLYICDLFYQGWTVNFRKLKFTALLCDLFCSNRQLSLMWFFLLWYNFSQFTLIRCIWTWPCHLEAQLRTGRQTKLESTRKIIVKVIQQSLPNT